MSFLAKLLPSEEKFYVLMRDLCAQASGSAVLLKEFTSKKPGNERDAIGARIAKSKAESKELMARISREVSLSFVTPFDREDIQEFCGHLYRITKTMDKIRERLELHNILADEGDFSRQVELIVEESEAMHDIVEALTKKGSEKTIIGKVATLHQLEAHGDEVLGQLLKNLFKGDRDIRDLILRKDVYDMLEKVLDRYRDASAVALQIVLKHS